MLSLSFLIKNNFLNKIKLNFKYNKKIKILLNNIDNKKFLIEKKLIQILNNYKLHKLYTYSAGMYGLLINNILKKNIDYINGFIDDRKDFKVKRNNIKTYNLKELKKKLLSSSKNLILISNQNKSIVENIKKRIRKNYKYIDIISIDI